MKRREIGRAGWFNPWPQLQSGYRALQRGSASMSKTAGFEAAVVQYALFHKSTNGAEHSVQSKEIYNILQPALSSIPIPLLGLKLRSPASSPIERKVWKSMRNFPSPEGKMVSGYIYCTILNSIGGLFRILSSPHIWIYLQYWRTLQNIFQSSYLDIFTVLEDSSEYYPVLISGYIYSI